MATSAWVALGSVSLSSNSTTVAFGSIAQSYRDLALVINGNAVSGESYFYLYFNGDTGSNYSRVEMTGNGSSGASASFSNLIPITLNSTSTSTCILNIMDYSATDKHKTVLYRNNSTGSTVEVIGGAGRWASTQGITSIEVTGYLTASIASGTTLTLYGSNRV